MPTKTEVEILQDILPENLYGQIINIIAGTKKLGLVMQSSHLDYDWIGTFWQYLRYGTGGPRNSADKAIQTVLDKAADLVSQPGFTFSVAEMRFLQEAIRHNPSLQEALQNAGVRFDIIGAAVETPDALLPPGEAFIRCYLQGYLWAANAFPTTDLLTCAWLPDSFGFCSSLPILYNAMGIGAVGLTRFPGSKLQQPQNGRLAGYLYSTHQVDFQWLGADGSPLLVHWMQWEYNQPFADADALEKILTDTGIEWSGNAVVAPTQYSMVPIGDDLACPNPTVATTIANFNARGTPFLAATATVAQYIQLINFHQDRLHPVDLRENPPTPYWTGFYEMHPAIKQLLRRGTMAALAAEAFGALAMLAPNGFGTSELQPTIDAVWGTLAIGTSHNILTGAAMDLTVYAEQRPFLEMGCGGAETARNAVVSTLAQATWRQPYDSTGTSWPIVIFQQNSVREETAALVEYVPDPALGLELSSIASITPIDSAISTPIQWSSDQTLLFKAVAPALGYQRATLSTSAPNTPLGELTFGAIAPGGFFLQNEYLRAEFTDDGLIERLLDRQTQANVLSGPGNDLVFYNDYYGSIYRFGNETGLPFPTIPATWGAGTRTVLETGPVRLRVRCEATASVNGGSSKYIREYALVAGEPFLRIATSGVAPAITSMFASVPLASIDGVQYGTMVHWDDLLPQPQDGTAWPPPYFFVSHDFVVATASGTPTAAIYHECMPCWSKFGTVLLGCLARNPNPAEAYGAGGSDFDRFTQVYAIRVGTGLQPAASMRPLLEARTFSVPMQTRIPRQILGWSGNGPGHGTPSLRAQHSLARITQGTGYITAAKTKSGAPPETLILRIYTPPPGQPIQVLLGGSPRADDSTMQIDAVAEVTALELPVTPGIPITVTGTLTFRLTPLRCLTTVAVTFLSSGGSDANPCSLPS